MDTHMTTMHAGPGVAPTTAASGDRAPALPGPATLAAYIAAHSKMRESADIAQIAPALVRAQGAMENPPRNRSVQVRTQAGSYTFRYATLDKITDMIRHALVENGLCLLQPIVGTERGPALVTRLLHESGQWMECEVLLPALGNNPQAFGSAVTYVRRYSVCALLNISADEDDDANRAAGNHYADVAPAAARAAAKGAPNKDRARAERAPPRATAASANAPRSALSGDAGAASPTPVDAARALGNELAQALVSRARVAESVEDGHALLEAWQRDAVEVEALRGTKAWEGLERELGTGLKRSLGVDPAAAFIVALRATDPQQVTGLQQHWEGKWADTLSAMQQEAPATYALLRRHVAAQIARVRSLQHAGDAPAAPAFAAHLRDETGEVASDPITTPLAFAEAYAQLWHATDADTRMALARHNAKALAQTVQDAAACAVLNALAIGETDTAAAPPRAARANGHDRQPARTPASLPARASSPPGTNGAGQAARPPRTDAAAPASIWAIVRPGKDAITAPDGPAWLKWWQDMAAKAAEEGKVDALRTLNDANAATWDGLVRRSTEAEAVVAEAARAVKDVLEA